MIALFGILNVTVCQWSANAREVLSRAFASLAKRLGLHDLHFHDLRHDAGSTLTMAGVPQRTIMAILGHRDPRMTMRYQHLAPAHLHDAMKALGAIDPNVAPKGKDEAGAKT